VYSIVKYKTPWLVINAVVPLSVAATWFLAAIYARHWGGLYYGTLVSFVYFGVAGYLSYTYNFAIPYGTKNPYSYTHTSAGMLSFINDLQSYQKQLGREPQVTIGVDGYWPLPYYFRDRTLVGYQKVENPEQFAAQQDIIVLNHTQEWDPPGWTKKYYRMSDVAEGYAFFKQQ
jgi:predicted membrane-bound mannosyltransferase